ncbi:MAG: hypothetical protein P1P84_07400 [Deferrisomatales bacterium]|nr:hypothetical protein [Deferrisomatales bacterium]
MTEPVQTFIAKWRASGGAERANYQHFLVELCDVLGVPRPDPSVPDDAENAYVFERAVTFCHGDGTTSTGRIDLYKRGAYVLEAKQGTEKPEQAELAPAAPKAVRRGTAVRHTKGWDDAMVRARGQAEQYARALPAAEGRPPFLIVVDVGHTIELYAEFSRTGGAYVPFPDPRSHRVRLADLEREDVRQRLKAVWLDPLSLDPSRIAAEVTREVAARLADLARSLERAGHPAEDVAGFLMRCLFTMFAEDVELLPVGCFTRLLDDERDHPDFVPLMLEGLWDTMKTGGFSQLLRTKVLRFNGSLFADRRALPMTPEQLALLARAARADWRHVEPAIFGVLLERALDPRERHALGAHFTPRAHVERLVFPTVIEPLREEWAAVQAAAYTVAAQGRLDKARDEVRAFHRRLCEVRILDPACGTANFLYVTLEHLKRLEGEVLTALHDLGESQIFLDLEGHTVDPHQFLGIEVNPRAAAIADVVLWIGYLQWHFRTRGQVMPPEPVLRPFKNIECRDAVLDWDGTEPVLGEDGQPVTRWDGVTVKPHPVTGEPVPDEAAHVPLVRYTNPRRAAWPEAEFIVGNPPYVGNKRMRQALGDGYVEALRAAHPDVPETVDLVMYWWHEAAERVRTGKALRFGFVTTNSLTQTQNRKVVQAHLAADPPLSLAFAIPDHPWVESADGADVRVAMTVGQAGQRSGVLCRIDGEQSSASGNVEALLAQKVGLIGDDLRVGARVTGAAPLEANKGLCFQGVILVGEGFRLERADLATLGLLADALPPVVRPYVSGKDLVQKRRERWVIDLHGLSAAEVLDRHPALYQRVYDTVRPARLVNRDAQRRRNWWLFGRSNEAMRNALGGLPRYIATVETSKHKPFVLLPAGVCPDHKLYAVASGDAFVLGVLSSRVHQVWALAAGGRLGVGNDPTWTNGTCFLPFPFPAGTEDQRARIRDVAERLDAHRKRQQAQHPGLTLTKTYNVLAKLRSGAHLTPAEREVHDQGLVSVLRQLHDELDAAVLEAYGWPSKLTDEELLERLVALNAERAAEEKRGLVRWLRPELQARGRAGLAPPGLALEGEDRRGEPRPTASADSAKPSKAPWPKPLAEQARAVLATLREAGGPTTAEQVARSFRGAATAQLEDLLETLVTLGQARRTGEGRYSAG